MKNKDKFQAFSTLFYITVVIWLYWVYLSKYYDQNPDAVGISQLFFSLLQSLEEWLKGVFI